MASQTRPGSSAVVVSHSEAISRSSSGYCALDVLEHCVGSHGLPEVFTPAGQPKHQGLYACLKSQIGPSVTPADTEAPAKLTAIVVFPPMPPGAENLPDNDSMQQFIKLAVGSFDSALINETLKLDLVREFSKAFSLNKQAMLAEGFIFGTYDYAGCSPRYGVWSFKTGLPICNYNPFSPRQLCTTLPKPPEPKVEPPKVKPQEVRSKTDTLPQAPADWPADSTYDPSALYVGKECYTSGGASDDRHGKVRVTAIFPPHNSGDLSAVRRLLLESASGGLGYWANDVAAGPLLPLFAKHGWVVVKELDKVRLYTYDKGQCLPLGSYLVNKDFGPRVHGPGNRGFHCLLTTPEVKNPAAEFVPTTPTKEAALAKPPVVLNPTPRTLTHHNEFGSYDSSRLTTGRPHIVTGGNVVPVTLWLVIAPGTHTTEQDFAHVKLTEPVRKHLKEVLANGSVIATGLIVGSLPDGEQRVWCYQGLLQLSGCSGGRLYTDRPMLRPLSYEGLVTPKGHLKIGGFVPKSGPYKGMLLRVAYVSKGELVDTGSYTFHKLSKVGLLTPQGAYNFTAEMLMQDFNTPDGKPAGKVVIPD